MLMLSADKRASSIWKRMLKAYEAPSIDENIAAELTNFVKTRKAQMPDEWY